MLWNWYTIDSCFLASSWHNRSLSAFAGSCIGVAFLVVSLEFIRRCQREYDRTIVRQSTRPRLVDEAESTSSSKGLASALVFAGTGPAKITVMQQAVRSGFYMVQFALAYLIMLLAMYYNGYLIISIFLGAFLGHFIWAWDNITLGANHQETGTSCC
jgi:copper transporter 1